MLRADLFSIHDVINVLFRSKYFAMLTQRVLYFFAKQLAATVLEKANLPTNFCGDSTSLKPG